MNCQGSKLYFSLFTLLVLAFTISSCERQDVSYFPLSSSFTWYYKIDRKTAVDHYTLKEIVQNKGKQKELFLQQSFLGVTRHIKHDENGIFVDHVSLKDNSARRYPNTSTIFRYPLNTDENWKDFIVSQLMISPDPGSHKIISSIPVTARIMSISESVSVPAGTFHNCVLIESSGQLFIAEGKYPYQPDLTISILNRRWYAQNVGLIKEVQKEDSDARMYPAGSFVKELEKYEK